MIIKRARNFFVVGFVCTICILQVYFILSFFAFSNDARPNKYMHIVVSSFGRYSDDERTENLTWVPDSRPDSRVFLYQRHDPAARHFLATRNGYECMTYVHHIVSHYSSLPDVLVFIHADAPRHCPAITILLSRPASYWEQELRSELRAIPGYFPLSRIALNMSKQHLESFNFPLREYTRDVLSHCSACRWRANDVPGIYPPFTTTYIAGSFAVSRENILRYPLHFWEHWRRELESRPAHDRLCGSLELIWTTVWGGQPFVTPVDPSRHCGALFYTDISPLEGFIFVKDEDSSLRKGRLPRGYNGRIRLQDG